MSSMSLSEPRSSIVIAHFLSGLKPIQMLRSLGRPHHPPVGARCKGRIMNDSIVIILQPIDLFKDVLLLSCSSCICTLDKVTLAV